MSMQNDPNPVLEKAGVPWYDSNSACLVLAAAMFVVVLFGIDGINVARRISGYASYAWVPVLLVIAGLFVCVSCVTRLIRRYARGG